MARHIPNCRQRQTPEGKQHSLLLRVQGLHLPQYWLFLEVSTTATWRDLDTFFRHVWLECCGHLSSFTYLGEEFTDAELDTWGMERESRSLGGRLANVLIPGGRFRYVYDFGTSTELEGQVLGLPPATGKIPKIRVLARNNPPEIPCVNCEQPAALINGESWDAVCDNCASGENEDLLPIVNSPRTGCCAYVGPSEE